MLEFLFETDRLTLFEHGHPPLQQRLAGLAPGAVGLTIVTIEESLRGRLAALARAPEVQHGLPATAAEIELQRLLALRLPIGRQDLKIAAIALARDLTVVSRNHRDFGRIPGLKLQDWSV